SVADTGPGDRGDDRRVEPFDPVEQRLPAPGQLRALMHGVELGELLDVGARAEELPAGREDDDAYGIVRFELPQGLVQLLQHRRGDEIRPRVVQGDGARTVGDGDSHEHGSHTGAPALVSALYHSRIAA